MTSLRDLPSIEQLLQSQGTKGLIAAFGRPLTLSALREVLDQVRAGISRDPAQPIPGRDIILHMAEGWLRERTMPTLLPVINATGVILHTNLGRAPLSASTISAMEAVSRNYSNLEFNLASGKRGSRLHHAETLLQALTGAGAAVVVNNNAAAVLLVLSALASRREVVIARSQLVEVGGGFRIPDVMKQSGARLVEVGTTNKVRQSDYQEALGKSTALIMHAHRSNFILVGFTEEPGIGELASIAHQAGIPCIDDLGSGALLDTAEFGMAHEPTVQESLAAGADIVCFSGDKLLGGPQAGIIVGKADLVNRIKTHPLARAVRADKTCLAGLGATLLHYLKDQARQEIPIWRMIATPPEQARKRVEQWIHELGQGELLESLSTVGGGSLPGETLPTCVLALRVRSVDKFMQRLRQGQPAVIARADAGQVLLDPRTVLPEQDDSLLAILKDAFTTRKPNDQEQP